MANGPDHATCVNVWLERSSSGRSPELRLQRFEAALGAIWSSTVRTLGEMTVTAIVERVLHNAGERFPDFSLIKVPAEGGIDCRELRERACVLDDPHVAEGIRYVLVELLTVLGNLTAEILTPELHTVLLQAGAGERRKRKDANS